MTKNEALTLIISALALVVSGFSLIDNHAQIVPQLAVVNPGFSLPEGSDPRVPVWVTILNKGELNATITEIDATPQSTRLLKDQDDCDKAFRDAGITKADHFGTLGDLPAGGVTMINPYVTLPKDCSEIPQQIVVRLAIRYHHFLHLPYTDHVAVRVIREKR